MHSQGLLNSNFGNGKNGALKVVEHLGYVQIDTLSVVARAHHHTLWNRLPDYQELYLNELLEKDKTIFEYWSHAASYLPMCDYRFSLPRKQLFATGKSHWFEQDKKVNKYVLERIKTDGPLQSKDFEHIRNTPSNWYEWKPAKRALEQLFMEGKLMVAKRQGFQKVYDLTERVLPNGIDTSTPTEKEVAALLIKRAIQSNGLVEEKEIAYLRPKLKEHIKKELQHLVKSGFIMEIKVENQSAIYFSTQEQLNALNRLKRSSEIHFLSPFDNAIIQRKRVQNLFNFDYQIECYVPEAKRKYGYFCLPILYNNQFVGRFDPKADRKTKTFYVKQLHFESNFNPTKDFEVLFNEKLNAFAKFNGCDKFLI